MSGYCGYWIKEVLSRSLTDIISNIRTDILFPISTNLNFAYGVLVLQ